MGQNYNLDREVEALKAQVQALTAQLQFLKAAPHVDGTSRLEAKQKAVAAVRQAAEKLLSEGAHAFEVSLPGSPLRRVHAENPHHALEKYQTFFGILRTSQTPNVQKVGS